MKQWIEVLTIFKLSFKNIDSIVIALGVDVQKKNVIFPYILTGNEKPL